ncbi:hypothetical protein BD769DRAFT_1666584 [Suillus cothurnatus]|nr:hypothetical protein BD769DRAFT_1666584 [Suillus cothurnatus]
MSYMLDGRDVSVVRDHSSSQSQVAMLFVSLDRSQDRVFRALVTLLKGDVRLFTQFLFTVRDTLPPTVVFGRDWFAFCHDIQCEWTLAEDFALPSVSTIGLTQGEWKSKVVRNRRYFYRALRARITHSSLLEQIEEGDPEMKSEERAALMDSQFFWGLLSQSDFGLSLDLREKRIAHSGRHFARTNNGRTMLSPSVAELIEIFDVEGAFVFVERCGEERPRFYVQRAREIKDAGSHFPTREDASVLIAPDLLFNMPVMMNDLVGRLANDITVDIIYAYTDELARHLVSEAIKLPNEPYKSEHGRLMDLVMSREEQK